MAAQVPLVAYLVLGEHPFLVARQCRQCGARFFDRRNACASCGDQAGFDDIQLPGEGSCVRSLSCPWRRLACPCLTPPV
jgi:uncharacterized protein